VPRYEIFEQIGRGGAATVYSAEDTQLGRRVALKVFDGAESESRILARLEHPGIVPVYDSGTLPDGRVFYAMKLIEGLRLDEYCRQPHPLSDRLRTFEKICEPVAFAHSKGTFHRDLKPSNIMIGEFGEVLVLDWSVPGVIIGTAGFMPPEQESGGNVDNRSDIFALGRILAAMSGEGTPKPLQAIGARATHREPGRRYQDVRELIADINHFLDQEPVSAYRESMLEKVSRFLNKNRVAATLILVYLVTRAVVLFFTGR
jgi:eukaryotic-like serine/threonine-protein kinase